MYLFTALDPIESSSLRRGKHDNKISRLGNPNGDRFRLIEVKFTVNMGSKFREIDGWPLNRKWPLNRGPLNRCWTVLSGQPPLRGHLANSRGWSLNRGLTVVFYYLFHVSSKITLDFKAIFAFTYFSFFNVFANCVYFVFFKFYDILFENHLLYEEVISIKIIIIFIT